MGDSQISLPSWGFSVLICQIGDPSHKLSGGFTYICIYRPHLGRHWCRVKGHPHKQVDVWLGPNALQEPSGQHTAKWGEEGGRIVPKACRGWGPPLPSPQQHSLGSRQTQELQLLSWTILAPWISNPLGQTQRHKPRKKRNLGVSRSGRMSLDKNSIFKI